MQNRKKLNQEIESKKKQRKLMERGIFALVAILLLAGIGYTVWNSYNMRWVMRINNEHVSERITLDDLRFYEVTMQENLGDPESRERILDEMARILTIMEHAERNNIVLSQEDLDDAMSGAENNLFWFEMIGMPRPVTNERGAHLLSAFFQLNHLRDIYVPYYTPDEAELAELWEEFRSEAETSGRFDRLELTYIYNDDVSAIEQAQALSAERSFAELEEFSSISLMTTTRDDIGAILLLDELSQSIVNNATLGEIFIVSAGEGAALIYASGMLDPDWDDLEQRFRDSHILTRRAELFNDILEGWVQDTNIIRNNRAINAF